MKGFNIIRNKRLHAYLYFNRPGEVADIQVKCDVRIASEVKFFIGKAVSVFFYIVLDTIGVSSPDIVPPKI